VTVIDGAADTVLATVPAGHNPYALCYNPENNKVYVANGNSFYVTVIDARRTRFSQRCQPETVALLSATINENNKVYAATNSTVSVIDGDDDVVIATVPGGGKALCYNQQNSRVYLRELRQR